MGSPAMTLPRFSRDFWVGTAVNLIVAAIAAFIIFQATF
jgi:hypothetical protein